jgi:hypothetical protein
VLDLVFWCGLGKAGDRNGEQRRALWVLEKQQIFLLKPEAKEQLCKQDFDWPKINEKEYKSKNKYENTT